MLSGHAGVSCDTHHKESEVDHCGLIIILRELSPKTGSFLFLFLGSDFVTYSLSDLELLLFDTFEMDRQVPPLKTVSKREYKKVCYEKWALSELYHYVTKKIYPKSECDIEKIIDFCGLFRLKMLRYSNFRIKDKYMFFVAAEITDDVIDVLLAMT